MSALLLAVVSAVVSAAPPNAPDTARIELGPAAPADVVVEDARGVVARARVGPQATAVVHVPPGDYVVRTGERREALHVEAGEVHGVELSGQLVSSSEPAGAEQPSARLPAVPAEASVVPSRPRAWRAPLMSTFVPGLGHAWAGKPLWGVGILAVMAGSVTGAVVMGRSIDRSDGATPSDAARSPGYARLAGFAALTSVASALYVGQIFDAHRVERGTVLRPVPGRVQLRFDRLTAVAMAPGRPRAALYDDLSLAAMVRLSPRVHVGASDASVKLGPEQTVLQLGVRAMAQLYGPLPQAPLRRVAVSVGGGVLGQATTRRGQRHALDPAAEPTASTQRDGTAVPYLLADARLFVAPRWSVGALGRLGVPLRPRRYRAGAALPAYGPTIELGVSLGVNL
ncbi:MAG: hypothetical protein ACE37F_12820 [Nannocystaceae bacterium]|nr:hypothetical protein [bacterium]